MPCQWVWSLNESSSDICWYSSSQRMTWCSKSFPMEYKTLKASFDEYGNPFLESSDDLICSRHQGHCCCWYTVQNWKLGLEQYNTLLSPCIQKSRSSAHFENVSRRRALKNLLLVHMRKQIPILCSMLQRIWSTHLSQYWLWTVTLYWHVLERFVVLLYELLIQCKWSHSGLVCWDMLNKPRDISLNMWGEHHIRQGISWSQLLLPMSDLPQPEEQELLKVHGKFFSKLPEASKVCRELLCCGCTKGWWTNCKCKKAALPCTALCECTGSCWQVYRSHSVTKKQPILKILWKEMLQAYSVWCFCGIGQNHYFSQRP